MKLNFNCTRILQGCMLLGLFCHALYAQQELWMSTLDANIIKQAEKQPKPLFQIPLGPHHIKQMLPLDNNQLLAGLKKDDLYFNDAKYILVDTSQGKIVWEYLCSKGEYDVLWTTQSSVILTVKTKKSTQLLGLDRKTGREVWKKAFKSQEVLSTPISKSESIIVYVHDKKGATLHSFNMRTGKKSWSTTVSVAQNKTAFVLVKDEKAFVFSTRISVLNIKNGQIDYTLADIPMQSLKSWIPAFDDQSFYVIDDLGTLHCCTIKDGRKRWSFSLPNEMTITNIKPTESKVFLNGSLNSGTYQIVALSKGNTQEHWVFTTNQPITSNYLFDGSQLYFGNAETLYAVHPETGERIFSKLIAKSGRSFPISLRKVGDLVVMVGELLVVAFDTKTGVRAYKKGFTPIGINLHFNGLDVALPALQERLASFEYTNSGAAQMASRESAYYQKMANEHYDNFRRIQQLGQSGSDLRASLEFGRYRTSKSMARVQSVLSLSFGIIELGNALESMMARRGTEAQIKRQQYYRNSILSVYTKALTEQYVYRPNLEYKSTDQQFVALDVVSLYSGKSERYVLSPQYLDLGLWNVVDFENRVIYHHGVGMDPSQYSLFTTKRAPMYKAKTVGTFLIAQPMRPE